jgi:hypothetical protein
VPRTAITALLEPAVEGVGSAAARAYATQWRSHTSGPLAAQSRQRSSNAQAGLHSVSLRIRTLHQPVAGWSLEARVLALGRRWLRRTVRQATRAARDIPRRSPAESTTQDRLKP